jgi:hypothetical protein
MLKGQVKVVGQHFTSGKDMQKTSRQLPAFLVTAFCFSTATSIVKTMFKDQHVAGQLQDSDGNIKDFEVGS